MAKTSIDVQLLYATLDAARVEKGISWRALAKEIGVSPSLLSRLANGLKPDTDSFATLVGWLRMPAETFFVNTDAAAEQRQPELMAQLAPLLRADKDLTDSGIAYLETVFAAAVNHVKSGG